ncbi:MAG: hypothetical protein KatS3mg111_1914 [Pirellulaceae bacterium]|nr:MAG: hypothetical protein KatS3mg111_1914 [Pirellulaceae bacterium]
MTHENQLTRQTIVGVLQRAVVQAERTGNVTDGTTLNSLVDRVRADLRLPPPSLDRVQDQPTDEVVAAFIEGRANRHEEHAIIAALPHDPFLLTVLVTEFVAQRTSRPTTALDHELVQSLQAKAPVWLSTSPRTARAATRPATRWRRTALHQLRVWPPQRLRQFLGVLAAAACLVIACLPWIAQRQQQPPWRVRDALSLNDDSHTYGEPNARRATAGSSDSRTSAGVDASSSNALAPFVEVDLEQSVQEIERFLTSTSGDSSSASAIAELQTESMPGSESTNRTSARHRPTWRDKSRPDHGSPAWLRWRRINGILAQSHRGSGVDQWRAVPDGDDPADWSLTPMADAATEWLTLPGSYAEAELAGGGRLVLREATNLGLELPDADDGESPALQLRFGSVAMLDIPQTQRLVIQVTPGRHSTIEVTTSSQWWMQRTTDGIQVRVADGRLHVDGQPVESGQGVVLGAEPTSPEKLDASLPHWAVALPEGTDIPRQILANIDLQHELPRALDHQLVRMGRMLGRANPLLVQDYLRLCEMRARLAVENPWQAATHPLAGVRQMAIHSLLTRDDDLIAVGARRELMQRLGISPLEARAWRESIVGHRPTPPRLVRQWLEMLEAPDPVVAAMGDFFLRQWQRGGPFFNPCAPPVARARMKFHWMQFLRDQRSAHHAGEKPVRPPPPADDVAQ